jgi:hypothetical protein
MRLIKTFLLHLYVDSEAPERICGNVRPLEDTESYIPMATLLIIPILRGIWYAHMELIRRLDSVSRIPCRLSCRRVWQPQPETSERGLDHSKS